MMGNVSFSGIQSGLNTDRIISSLLAIERRPQQRYKNQIDENSNKQDAYQDLNNRLENLTNKLDTLQNSSTYDQKSISNNKSGVLSASIINKNKVNPGSFDIFVEQLATSSSRSSGKQIHDQNMADTSQSATLISDFEQVEGSGTVDLDGTTSTSEMLGQLSKEIQTRGAGNAEVTLDLTDDSNRNTSIDLDQHSSFQQLFDAFHDKANNEGAGKDIDDDGTAERFQFGYDENKDKFFIRPLESDSSGNPGGNSLEADDNQTGIDNSKTFLQQLGLNSDETIHHYTDNESDTGENLIGLDPNKDLQDNIFTSQINFNASDNVVIKVNNTDITLGKTDTVSDFVTKVNDNVEGVNASFNSATDKVSLKTSNKGSGTIDVEDVDGNLADVLNLRDSGNESGGQDPANVDSGSDAEVTIDGDTVTAEGNTITFNGIQLDLKNLHKQSNNSGDPVKVEVSQDLGSTADDVEAFIKQFNSIMGFINDRNNTNPASEPGENPGDSGVFANDSTVQSIKNKLVSIVTSRFKDATGSNTIQDAGSVGIEQKDPLTTSDQDKNKLNFQAGQFKDALEKNPDEVKKLFKADTTLGDPADGLATQLDDYVDNAVTDSNDGILPNRIDGFDKRIIDLQDRIQDNQERVAAKRENLEAKFLRMEQTLTNLNGQQQFLSSRL